MFTLSFPHHVLTERLSIQRLKYEDAEEIYYAYASKPEATRYLTWPTHQSIADTQAFLRYANEAWKSATEYSFSIRLRSDSRLIGGFGITNDQGKLQIGYVFSPSQWGNGYATEACKGMTATVKGQRGVYRVQSFVDADNVPSAKVLIGSGMIEEARLPNWFRFINQENNPKNCILFRLPLA